MARGSYSLLFLPVGITLWNVTFLATYPIPLISSGRDSPVRREINWEAAMLTGSVVTGQCPDVHMQHHPIYGNL